ncbi:MAG: 4Fe-4S dicluster domain-containing protein [Desulfatibacillum sp.]|nr:4Fe-4S dicluster domain-containing protein [Desulfatibacillum sp.]
MKRRSFFGLVKPRLSYSAPPDLSSLPLEEVPASRTATFFVPGALESKELLTLKVGDIVKAGQRLAPFAASDDYAVSTLAGKVTAMEPYTDANANNFTAIMVEADAQKEWVDALDENPDLATVAANFQNGPGALCLKPVLDPEVNINTILILGMDQDLLVTAVQHVVKSRTKELAKGVKALKRITKVSKVILAAPSYLVDAVKNCDCEVKEVDTVYPNATPKLVMHKLLGITVPAGKDLIDMGVLCVSAEAVAALGESCTTGKACTDKILTLINKDEEAVNVKVRIGTPIKDVLALKSIMVNSGDRLILGGPMTGVATYSVDLPVQPDTDAIMVQDADNLSEIEDAACINCGECVQVCPAKIPVNVLVRFLENKLYVEGAERFDLLSCVDCGLCSYVCPARIPIYQYIGLAKHELSRMAPEAE